VSAEAVEIVRRFWDSARASESEFLWEALHPEVELRDFDLPDATGVYRGHDGFSRWVSDWGEAWEDYRMEPAEYVDAGEKVLVVFSMWAKGKGSGVEIERQDGMVCTVRDGKVSRVDYYGGADRALEAAGLQTQAGDG
jgi:ketosteroid isomerase-like protein